MLVLLILPILISGFLVQKYHLKRFYNLHKYSGQLLYLKTALIGSFCLAFSFIFTHILLSINYLPFLCFDISFDILSFLIEKFKTSNIDKIKLPYLTFLFFNTILFAFLYSFFANFWGVYLVYRQQWVMFIEKTYEKAVKDGLKYTEETKKIHSKTLFKNLREQIKLWKLSKTYYIGLIRKSIAEESLMNKLLWESFENTKDLIFHMKDKKVYIGSVSEINDITDVDKLANEISIFPLKSGYRDKDKLTVEITTNYKLEDALFIILRKDEILSITEYNEEIFDTFQKDRKKSKSFEMNFKERKFEMKIKI